MNSIHIRRFKLADIPVLIQLSDSLFGENFITEKEFKTYSIDASKIGFVAVFEGEIAGFLLLQICEMESFLEYAVSEKEWFRSHFSESMPVGVYKSIGVAEQFKKKGIGRLLTQKGIESMPSNTKAITAICWEQEETPLLPLLEKFDFQFTRKIDHFWTTDSLRKKYSCKICGTPPCKCNAFIYTLNL